MGRVIRHKEDFGSILLLDKRFSIEANVAKLSSWLPKPQKHRDFKLSVKSLEDFLHFHSSKISKKDLSSDPVDLLNGLFTNLSSLIWACYSFGKFPALK